MTTSLETGFRLGARSFAALVASVVMVALVTAAAAASDEELLRRRATTSASGPLAAAKARAARAGASSALAAEKKVATPTESGPQAGAKARLAGRSGGRGAAVIDVNAGADKKSPSVVGTVVEAPTSADPAATKAKKKSAKKKKKAPASAIAATGTPKRKVFIVGRGGDSWPNLGDEPVVVGKKAKKGKNAKIAAKGADGAVDGGGSAFDSFWWGGGSSGDPDLEIDLTLGAPTLSPAGYGAMQAAIDRYERIVAGGGWHRVPMAQMGKGMQGDSIAMLRRRLEIEGDIAADAGMFGGSSFDYTLEEGVRRFQFRNGLKPTGDLLDRDLSKNGTRTLNALNVPAESRLKQLATNLGRIKAHAKTAAKRYVVVNIPAQEIEAVNGDRVELRLTGVVGKPDRPSPLLSSTISQLKFSPVWTLPPTVIREDLIPKGRELQRKGDNVLVKFGIDAYGASGKLDPAKINWSSAQVNALRFSQQPGKDNPLGFVKIDFPSPHAVYMHDTPSPRLFEKSYRAASSGCVRVQHVEKLAAWLLRDNDEWSLGRVERMRKSGESLNVSLAKAVPLYWVYVTAWVTEGGTVHFRRDLYKKDVAVGVDQLAAAY